MGVGRRPRMGEPRLPDWNSAALLQRVAQRLVVASLPGPVLAAASLFGVIRVP
jgi:hypothetical protein